MWKPSDGYFTMRLDEDTVRTATCGYPIFYVKLYYGSLHRIGKIFRRYKIYEPGGKPAFIREFVFKVDDKYDAEKLQEEWIKRSQTSYMLKFDDRGILEIHIIITDIPLDEFRKGELAMPKKTCKTCIHARPICAGSSTMYCGHPNLSMLQFSLHSDDKVACEFYESKGCECIQERSCKDCEHFRSYDTKPGFGTCYHISVANTVSDKTAMICQWFSNDNSKKISREEIEDQLKNEKEDVSDERSYKANIDCAAILRMCNEIEMIIVTVCDTGYTLQDGDVEAIMKRTKAIRKELTEDAGTD